MSSEEDYSMVVVAASNVILAAVAALEGEDGRKDREWEGPITRRRRMNSVHNTTIPHLITVPDDRLPENRMDTFYNYFRMTKPEFDNLLRLVAPHIEKCDTSFRDAISTEERLMVTLR